MSQTEIKQAFLSHLSTLPGNTWRIAMPGTDFEPEANESYLEISFHPSGRRQACLGEDGPNENVGFVQVTIMGEDNQGFLPSSQKSDQILDHFKRGTTLEHGSTKVKVTKADPNPSLGVIDSKFNLPVSIYYRAYTPN